MSTAIEDDEEMAGKVRSLEKEYDDELLEITPTSLRLRKRHLDHNVRKRADKARKAAMAQRAAGGRA